MNKDSVIIVPAQQDGGTAWKAATLAVARSYFSEVIDVGSFSEMTAFLIVTANSGNPTLDVKLQWSPDKVHWIDQGDAFTQVTTTNSMTIKKITSNFGKYVRFQLSIGGTTPSYTFSLYLAAKT